MKSQRLKKIIVLLLTTVFLFASGDYSRQIVFRSEGLDFDNVFVKEDAQGKEIFRVRDLSYQKQSIPFTTDMVLSFNGEASTLVRDDTRKYRIRYASYNIEKGKNVLGGAAARFYKQEHRVEIESARSLWLANCSDLGSFTVEMRFRPSSISNGAVLFSKICYSSGIKSGMEILLQGKRVVTRLFKIFQRPDGRRVDVMMNRGSIIEENTWYHYAVSYDRISGKLASFMNGEEMEVIYVTGQGKPFFGVYVPSFQCGDIPLALIGKNYFGLVDEVRISYRHIEDLKKETALALQNYRQTGIVGRVPVNQEGVITSGVKRFPFTGTMITLFQWKSLPVRDTHIWMEFRISDDYFEENDTAVRWYRIDNNQRNIYLKKIGDNYLRGRYYQWRAHLVPSPGGAESPGLYDVSLHYRLDSAPRAPLFLESHRTGNKTVTLRWKKNVEPDIAGYRVYYGIQSGKYDGVVSKIRGQKISNSTTTQRNYVEVTIDNTVIEENRHEDKVKLLNYPVLKNDVLYYFAVSAYDSYRVDTKYNHESEPSNEISARPVAESDITK